MRIVNDCVNPPPCVIWHVRRSLRWINQDDLDGLDCILLLDEPAEITDETPESVRLAMRSGHLLAGQYVPQDKTNPACVMLFVNVIYRAIPFLYRWTTVPTVRVASNLARGVAYHVLAKSGHAFESEEEPSNEADLREFADHYVETVINRMRDRWYFRLGLWGVKDLAETYYIIGIHDWREKDYKKAAEHWSKAHALNPDHKDAAYWHGRAREAGNSENDRQPE